MFCHDADDIQASINSGKQRELDSLPNSAVISNHYLRSIGQSSMARISKLFDKREYISSALYKYNRATGECDLVYATHCEYKQPQSKKIQTKV